MLVMILQDNPSYHKYWLFLLSPWTSSDYLRHAHSQPSLWSSVNTFAQNCLERKLKDCTCVWRWRDMTRFHIWFYDEGLCMQESIHELTWFCSSTKKAPKVMRMWAHRQKSKDRHSHFGVKFQWFKMVEANRLDLNLSGS